MYKKTIMLLALLFIGYKASAQRIPFQDFLSLVKLTVDDASYPIMGINNFLRKNSEDWSKPSKEETDGEIAITWPYMVNDAEMGKFTATFRPDMKKQDGTYQAKATFLFPYKVQYDEYLKNVSGTSKLVNTFTRNGCTYRIYESHYYTWAFIIIPATTKSFFIDGVATEAYMLEVHHIL